MYRLWHDQTEAYKILAKANNSPLSYIDFKMSSAILDLTGGEF